MEEPKVFIGVTASLQPVTDYPMPDGANPAQVLGYLQPITQSEMAADHLPETGFAGDDLVGQAGLEAQYNTELTGKPGNQIVSVNAAGDVLNTVGGTPAQTGDTLVTSINAKVQAVAQQALNSAINRSRAAGNSVNQGAAVVETTSGRIVAMASYPDYNPSVWTNGISQSEFNYLFGSASGDPVMNYATQGQYPPGSTFKITSTAAAVADGFSLNGLYNCPATVTIGGHSVRQRRRAQPGPDLVPHALIQSCDTVYYNIGYQMWQTDDNKANFQLNPHAPTQKMQQMELDWGFGNYTGIDLPEDAPGTIPTRQWLYNMYEDNAHKGQNWCKNGKANGSYVQQIEYDDCQSGWVWGPGPGRHRRDRPGLRDLDPAAARERLHRARRRRHALQPEDRRGPRLRLGQAGAEDQPAGDQEAAGRVGDARLHALGPGRAWSPRAPRPGRSAGSRSTRSAWRARPVRPQIEGKNATSVFASFAPCQNPQFVVIVMLPNSGYGADAAAPAVRAIWDGIYGLEGHKAALPGGKLPADPRHREGDGEAMSVGLPSRGWAGPRAGTFAPRHQSRLGRAFAKGGVARSWDWLLFAVTCALAVLGTVLVWAATEPALRQAGLDPHTYLKKAILWAVLGFVLMMATACMDYRRIRRWTPYIYGLSLLLLLAVLAVGQSVNGAKAWISLPGGFQVEPSEFAKLGLILSAAWLLSRPQ